MAILPSETKAADKLENPELEKVRTLLKAHDEAMTNKDLKGVLATLAEKATIMGTGPGEIWSGPEEIKVAYEHFFEGYDKGQQKFDYQFKIGNLGTNMGWLMASGEITGQKAGKAFSFPLNVSLTVAKTPQPLGAEQPVFEGAIAHGADALDIGDQRRRACSSTPMWSPCVCVRKT